MNCAMGEGWGDNSSLKQLIESVSLGEFGDWGTGNVGGVRVRLLSQDLGGALVGLSDPLFVRVGLVLDPVELSVLVVNLVAHVCGHVLQIGHYV